MRSALCAAFISIASVSFAAELSHVGPYVGQDTRAIKALSQEDIDGLQSGSGMGYAKEYQVERLFRESMLPMLAPVTEQLILSYIGENVLDLPKSY